jgi:hypothetical protein
MSDPETPKYATLYCTVVGQPPYGLTVETDAGSPGYIDSEFIADEPMSRNEWPATGVGLRVVVLGNTRDGRLILSARKSDFLLFDSVVDPHAAAREWQPVNESEADSAAARDRFYQSEDALALLRWASSRLPGTADWKLAQALLSQAPVTLKIGLGLE